MKLAIIGKHTSLCQCELEAICGSVEHINADCSLADIPSDVSIDQFGGVIKLCQIISRLKIKSNPKQTILDCIIGHIANQDTKISFGISYYPQTRSNFKQATELAKLLKRQLIDTGLKVRYIPTARGTSVLNAAQVRHNNLLNTGFEFIVVQAKDEIIVAVTEAVQDIDWYSNRDHGRPCRDTKTGLLPPKLAQIMINLSQSSIDTAIYDPFCGSGTILQEALLMGHDAYGSDIDAQLVRCTNKNLDWLGRIKPLPQFRTNKLDATRLKLSAISLPQNIAIVTEGFLGNVNQFPNPDEVHKLKKLYLDFLANFASQLKAGTKIVIALPVWNKSTGYEFMPILDQIIDIGYNITVLRNHPASERVYMRAHQRVGRQIILLTR